MTSSTTQVAFRVSAVTHDMGRYSADVDELPTLRGENTAFDSPVVDLTTNVTPVRSSLEIGEPR